MTRTTPLPLRGVAASTDKPVLAFGRIAQNSTEISRRYQHETGVPFIHGLPETVRAMQHLARYAAVVRKRTRGGRAVEAAPPKVWMTPPSVRYSPAMTFHRQGVRFAETSVDAAAQAVRIGFPVAVKIVSPQASHKTEVGGVVVGIRDEAAARAAAESDGGATPGP